MSSAESADDQAYLAAQSARDRARESIRRLTADIQRITSSPPPRILVVDDDAPALAMLAEEFRKATGLEVIGVRDATEASRMLEHNDFAAVILDMHLEHPSINGVTLAEMVPRGRVLAIVSGDDRSLEVADALDAMCIQKPCSLPSTTPGMSSVEEVAEKILEELRGSFS